MVRTDKMSFGQHEEQASAGHYRAYVFDKAGNRWLEYDDSQCHVRLSLPEDAYTHSRVVMYIHASIFVDERHSTLQPLLDGVPASLGTNIVSTRISALQQHTVSKEAHHGGLQLSGILTETPSQAAPQRGAFLTRCGRSSSKPQGGDNPVNANKFREACSTSSEAVFMDGSWCIQLQHDVNIEYGWNGECAWQRLQKHHNRLHNTVSRVRTHFHGSCGVGLVL